MKTMREVLAACTDEQVALIVKLWAGEPNIESRQRVIEMLLKRMVDPIAARFAWEYLTDDERQILYRAMAPSTRYGVRHDALLKKSQLSAARYEAAVNSLVQYALLQEFEQSSRQMAYIGNISKAQSNASVEKVKLLSVFNENVDPLYAVGREIFTPSGDRSRWDLDKLLSQLSEAELYKIIKNYDIQQGPYYSRSDLGYTIIEHLLDIREPLDHLPNIDAQSRRLSLWLREHSGRMGMQDVRDYMKMDDATLLKALHTLAQCALAFDTFSKNEHVLFVPEEFYDEWKSVTSNAGHEPVKKGLIEREGEPPAIRSSENITIYDLATLMGAIYQQTIEPTQAGKVPKRISNKLRPLLRGQPRLDYLNEDEYLEIVLDAARQLNIVQLADPPVQDIKPAYEAGPFVGQWANFSLLEQTRRLLLYWIANFGWRDVYGVNYGSWSTYSWDASEGRKALLRQLDKCVPGQWYTISSLLEAIWDEDAFAFRPVPIYGRQSQLRKNRDTRAKWDRCEGEVYTGILASTLYELGIVSLGYEDSDALTVTKPINPDLFMLTDIGGAIMAMENSTESIEATEPQPLQRTLIVQPNFDLLLLQPDLRALYDLLPFAQANQLGVVSRLTLTRTSVLRGMRAGKNIEQILGILQQHSQKELPQNVEYTLRDWTKNYKDARISQVLLFEVSSEEVGQILGKLPALQGLGIRQLGPCIFAVSGDVDLQALRKALDKEGIAVQLSGEIFTRPRNPYSSYVTFGRYR